VNGPQVALIALPGIPSVAPGDDLVALIGAALAHAHLALAPRDVVAVAQKAVSKSEDRYVDLATVVPSPRAHELAAQTRKDPRIVEVILGESRRVVRAVPHVLIVEHRLGYIMANAGVDQSNLPDCGQERVLRLPEDPDASAERIRAGLAAQHGVELAVIVTDSFGRPWRQGSTGVALGAAGFPSLVDMRGRADLFGRKLQVTMVALADQVAAAATLLMGEADEAIPVVVVRGVRWQDPARPARSLLRPADEDLFR
jgi:coenzyme F420-0:L-glutamate ligase/coenzyme F420-1:gamma-L-glutamate ligase